MRILMAATGDFALPTFRALLSSGHELVALITQPDRPAGRGRQVHVSPIKQAALDRGLPVLQPERIAAPPVVDQIAALAPDVFLVAAYGQKIPRRICTLPARGSINLHASLLPELRGAAPCNWAIIRGYAETGVTVQYLADRIDAGDVLGCRSVAIEPRETAPQLRDRLAVIGADLTLDVLTRLAAGTASAAPQDELRVTVAPLLKKEDGLIDWRRSAFEIDSLVRGIKPWPGAYTYIMHPGRPGMRLVLDETLPLDAPDMPGGAAGTIVRDGKDMLVVTGHGMLKIVAVKPDSGKLMAAEAFCNGHQIKTGDQLSSAES